MQTIPILCPQKDLKVNYPYGVKYTGKDKVHTGIDLDATDAFIQKNGEPFIVAPCDGTVYRVGYDERGWGHYVVLDDNKDFYHILAHMKKVPLVKPGTMIKAGTKLGILGTTGNSTGVHLHYEIRREYGNKQSHYSPAKYLQIDNTKGAVKMTAGPKKDTTIAPWAKDAQAWVIKNKISDGTRPKDAITREEAWAMLHNFFKSQQ